MILNNISVKNMERVSCGRRFCCVNKQTVLTPDKRKGERKEDTNDRNPYYNLIAEWIPRFLLVSMCINLVVLPNCIYLVVVYRA